MSTTLSIACPRHRMPVRRIYCRAAGQHLQPMTGCAPWDRYMASGDAVLYRADRTLEDLLIASATGCLWIHAGMLAWNEDEEQWEILDTRQWHGGQRTPLSDAVRDNPGHWDLFAANAGDRWPELNRRLAVAKMDEFVGRPYGWASLLRDGLSHLPLAGGLAGDLCDGADGGRLPFCSQAVVIATRIAGVDPVPNRAAAFVEPVHLAQSPFYQYRGTFWPAN